MYDILLSRYYFPLSFLSLLFNLLCDADIIHAMYTALLGKVGSIVLYLTLRQPIRVLQHILSLTEPVCHYSTL